MLIMDILVNPNTAEVIAIFPHSGEILSATQCTFGPTQAAFMKGYMDKLKRRQVYPLYNTLRMFKGTKEAQSLLFSKSRTGHSL
jgi:hypothetical protein